MKKISFALKIDRTTRVREVARTLISYSGAALLLLWVG